MSETFNDDHLKKELDVFLENNPKASIDHEDKKFVIRGLWEDDTICLRVSDIEGEFIEILNSTIFPPPFSAIFHIEEKSLEFIFSVRSTDDYLWERKFDFIHNEITYSCEFNKSSEKLMRIAQAASPIKPISYSDHRNLRIYRDYSKRSDLPDPVSKFFKDREPMSFFVSPISIENLDYVIDLAMHLNFYMAYFDKHTPQIFIHRPEDIQESIYEKDGKVDVKDISFPDTIVSHELNSYMLDLWVGSRRVSGRMKYIYNYQLLEYASFYFIEEEIKINVRKILRRPEIISSIDTCIPLILDEIVNYRKPDEQKMTMVVKKSVEPYRVWKVIEEFMEFFSKPINFDGGFNLDPLVKEDWDVDDFIASWIPKIPDNLRWIRNALVHSREFRMGKVITPTRSNNKKLLPWTRLIEEITNQVVNYHDF
jgi:hypothetical protein